MNNKKITIALFILILVTYLLVSLYKYPPFFTATDMHAWGLDSERLKDCLTQARFPCKDISYFPLAYLLNSKLLLYTGINYNINNNFFMGVINLAILFLPIIVIYLLRGINYGLIATIAYIPAFILSPILPFYIYSGALEVQSGVFMGIFMGSSVLYLQTNFNRKLLALFVLFFSGLLATFYKDTNIFLIISVIVLLFIQEKYIFKNQLSIYIKYLKISILMLFIGISLGLYFNYIKSGNILPIAYIGMAKVGPDLMRSVKYFFTTFISPNGGILIFWMLPLFINFIIFSLFDFKYQKSCLSIAIIFILFSVAGFSLWTGTFGWSSWGNRYIIPSMIAVMIMLTLTSSRDLNRTRFRGYIFYASAPIIILSGLYIFVSYISKDKANLYALSLDGGKACKSMIIKMNSQDYKTISFKEWYTSKEFIGCENERLLNNPIMIYLKAK